MTSPGERPSVRQQKTKDSMEALQTATLEIIAEVGIKGLTLGAVAARAGVSRGLPNYHFGSKSGLIRHVVEAMLAQRIERYRARPDVSGINAIYKNLDQVVGYFHDHPKEQMGFAIMMAEGLVDPDPQIRELIAHFNRNLLALIAARFEEALAERNPSSKVDPMFLASIYNASLVGFTLRWAAEPDLVAMDRDIKGLRTILTNLIDDPGQEQESGLPACA